MREDGIGESGNTSKDGGAEQDAPNDLGDDAGLTEVGEGEVEEAAEDDDDARLQGNASACSHAQMRSSIAAPQDAITYLNDEDDDGVLWIIVGGVSPVEDPGLRWSSHDDVC